MKRKWLTVLVATLLVATALPLSGAKAADTALLGVSVPTLDDLFYTDMVAGAQAMADEMDMTLVVMSAENDAETELENVQALLEQDVALLLFSPVDVEESADALTLLDEADVPVILVGEGLSADAFDVDVAGVVTPDEHLIGSLAAEAMCSALDGQGVVAEVVDGRDGADRAVCAGLANDHAWRPPQREPGVVIDFSRPRTQDAASSCKTQDGGVRVFTNAHQTVGISS